MDNNTTNLEQIEYLIQFAKDLSKKYEIIMTTSNKQQTDNTTDYLGNSVKAEFFSDQEELLIFQTVFQ